MKKNISSRVRITGLLLALALTGAGGLAACSAGSKGGADGQKVFSISAGEPARGLIPAIADDQDGVKVVDQLFAGLVTYDPEGKVVKDVAKDIQVSADAKTWKITLNQDRKFSDNTAVKAQNFVRAWKQSAFEKMAATTAFAEIEGAEEDGTGNLSGVEAKGDWEIEIRLKRPVADFDARLGINGFYPLPDSAFDKSGKINKSFAKNPVGNGPYILKQWLHEQRIELRKSPTYKGVRQPQNDGVNFLIYAKPDAGYSALLGGDLDILDRVPSNELANWEKDLGNRRLSGNQAAARTIDIDYKVPHFSGEEGKLRRQAISMAIDREEIVKTALNGAKVVATDFMPAHTTGHTDQLKNQGNIQFNPKKAKELWQKADQISPWTGDFPIAYNADADHRVWVEAMAHQLTNNLGIKAVGQPVPSFPQMLEDMRRHAYKGAFRMGWTMGYPSPSNLLAGRFIKNGNGNKSNYDNPVFDELIRKAQTITDLDQRLKTYSEAQDILAEDLPSIPLWSPKTNIGYSERVNNLSADWKGDVALERVKVS